MAVTHDSATIAESATVAISGPQLTVTDRTALRALIQENTDQQLTATADQDNWLNRGEMLVMRRWIKFEPGRFRSARTSGTTDANGLLSLDADVMRLERLEDANKVKYEPIDDINNRWDQTGYYEAQYDTANQKVRLQAMKAGAVLANTTLYWYDLARLQMGIATDSVSVIPEDFRQNITTAGTYLFFRSHGPALASTTQWWKREFSAEMEEARSVYRRFSKETTYIESSDPDAGGGHGRGAHVIS